MFWRKRKHDHDTKNWMDDYAPRDAAEAAYFFGQSGALVPDEAIVEAAPGKNRRRIWFGFALMTLVGLMAGGVYVRFFSNRLHNSVQSMTPQNASMSTAVAAVGPSKHRTATMVRYNAINLAAALSYPADWKLSETTAGITIQSPEIPLSAADKAVPNVKGMVRVSIQPQQKTLAYFKKGSATSIRSSELLRYVAPGPQQRPTTYLSFVRFAANDTETMDALFVTGPNAYTLSQSIPEDTVLAADPLISVRFIQSCATTACNEPVFLRVPPHSWQDDAYAASVRAIIQSLIL
jgi:hypothetical protein